MPSALLVGFAALMTATAAHAAPNGIMRSLSASSEQASTESEAPQPGMLATILDVLQFKRNAKAVAAAAPASSEPTQQTGSIKECEQNDADGQTAEKKHDEKLAKQTGPEPIYLAF